MILVLKSMMVCIQKEKRGKGWGEGGGERGGTASETKLTMLLAVKSVMVSSHTEKREGVGGTPAETKLTVLVVLKSMMVSSHTGKREGGERGTTIRDKDHSGVGAEVDGSFQPHREE